MTAQAGSSTSHEQSAPVWTVNRLCAAMRQHAASHQRTKAVVPGVHELRSRPCVVRGVACEHYANDSPREPARE